MNILFLTNHVNAGGITSYVLSLASGLLAEGDRVYIASSGGDCLARFTDAGAVFFPIPIMTKSELSPAIAVSLFKLLPYIKKNDIQLIHANTRVTQLLAALLQRFSGRPYLSTCHGFFKTRLSRRLFPLWGKRVIAISPPVREHLAADFKVPPERIRVIPHGIDTSRFSCAGGTGKPQRKKELGLGPGPVIGIVARLSDVKGHRYLIEAMKPVVAEVPDAQLLIVGEGKMEPELAALRGRLGLEQCVRFMPTVSDTAGVLAAMDIFVMPSLNEGLGLGIMEAMACGLPVIGSAVGGIRSLIVHGTNGLLVEPADAKQLAGAMLELLKDPPRRTRLGERGRLFIAEHFSLEQMISETRKVYAECIFNATIEEGIQAGQEAHLP
ncbi:MAG TPA: glycosyltransferase family 4 protein [Patescibacteria group bacterium]|nr:glycosyltransferase family 4 protein [Patescibacteria group bacterium]